LPRLLLIDGYSLLFRAFYALPPLRTSAGVMTNAVHGFLRMLLRVQSEEQPTHLAIAWDSAGPTFRHEQFADYKGTRRETPNDLEVQDPILREVLDALRLPQVELPRYEADDLLGTLARRGEDAGFAVLIVTGDHDALQLASDLVTVIVTERGISQTTRFTPAVVEQRMGIRPAQVPDYKGLRGDTSDNIPGVPGIGEKTARQLMQQFGSVDELLARVAEVEPPRIRDLLIVHASQARHSRFLATIDCAAPLAATLDELQVVEPNLERTFATLTHWEMHTLAGEFKPVASIGEPSVAETEWLREPAEVLRRLNNSTSCVALAFEQDGLSVTRVAGVIDDTAFCLTTHAPIADWLADQSAPKVVHDAKTALRALRATGHDLQGLVGDTAIMAHLLDSSKSHSLNDLARRYLGQPLTALPSATPPASSGSLDFGGATSGGDARPAQLIARARATRSAYFPLALDITKAGLDSTLRDVEQPLGRVLAEMEAAGMLVEVARLHVLGARLATEAARLEREVHELAGTSFNLNSPKQLQAVLFEQLKLPRGRKTKTGYSTDAGVLEKLAEQHEVVRKILDYRELTKLNSTFVAELIACADPVTQRVHTTLVPTGAATGRLASHSPNLLNIPIRTEWGKEIRRAFIAPPGQVLVCADYSQIELRVLAHLSRDANLLRAFEEGVDIHTRTAAQLYGIELEAVTAEMRRRAKVVNFGIAYGISGFGLSQQLGIEPGEGNRLIESYFATFPGVRDWIDATLTEARATGYVSTLLGRRRPVPDLTSPVFRVREAAERVAVNLPVQGTAADIIKMAMVRVTEELRRSELRARLLLQVHDELVFECPRAEVAALAKKTRQAMSHAIELGVPLTVDVEFGDNWMDLRPVDEGEVSTRQQV